jgi:hypothetical protein
VHTPLLVLAREPSSSTGERRHGGLRQRAVIWACAGGSVVSPRLRLSPYLLGPLCRGGAHDPAVGFRSAAGPFC